MKDATWGEIEGFIEDKTRSGKTKRRSAYSCTKRQFNIKMLFTYSQYASFRNWYRGTTKNGTLSFYYPNIESETKSLLSMTVYRFAIGGAPKFSNPSGKLIQCSMIWESE